jgi:hexokinase
MNADPRCRQFLGRHHLLSSQYNQEEIVASFLKEMDDGLTYKESSLAMIPSYIGIPERAPKNEKLIVLDAGGTNFRTAVIRFDSESVPHTEYFTNNPMPGIEKELTKEEFFNLIADYIAPVVKESDRLGFCFSYPTNIDAQKDGTLLYWSKEIKARAVIGERILANIAATLTKRNLPCPSHMRILNDTVAALLAGVTATRFSPEYDYVGYILGTGTNAAYVESTAAIKKAKGLPPGSMAINCEAANFNGIVRGDIDLAFAATTAGPDKYVLEKMASGAYIGGLCKTALATAVNEGLLSESFSQTLSSLDPSNAKFIDDILSEKIWQDPATSSLPESDRKRTGQIVNEIVERAAMLAAITMASPIVKVIRDGRKKKFCIAADGSVYFKMFSFRERAERHLSELLKPYDADYMIVKTDDAPIIGAAVAGLT